MTRLLWGKPRRTGLDSVAGRPVWAALVALVWSAVAFADRGDATGMLGLVPRGSELAVVVDDAAALRGTPAGRAVLGWIRSMETFDGTRSAWSELAAQLGLDEDDAAERLLGRRFAVVLPPASEGSNAEPEGSTTDRGATVEPWTLISVVDEQTAALLRRGLNLSLRGVTGGRPVHLSEAGRVRVVLARLDVSDRDDGTTLFVAGPRRYPETVDAVAAALSSPVSSRSVVAEPAVRRLVQLSDRADFAVVLLASRGSPVDAAGVRAGVEATDAVDGAPRRERFAVAGSVSGDGELLRLTIVAERGEGTGEADVAGEASALWADRTFEAMADGAAIAWIDSLFGVGFAGAINDAAGGSAIVLSQTLRSWWSGPIALAAYPDAEAPLSIALAVDTAHRVKTLRSLDALVASWSQGASVLGDGEGGAGVAAHEAPVAGVHDLNGLFPDAMRHATLAGVFASLRSLNTPLISGASRFAWTSRASTPRRPFPAEGGEDARDAPGWLVLGIGASGVRQVADAVVGGMKAEPGEGDRRPIRWLSIGMIDFELIESIIAAPGGRGGDAGRSGSARGVFPDMFAALRSVWWRVLRLDESLVAGQAELRFVAADGVGGRRAAAEGDERRFAASATTTDAFVRRVRVLQTVSDR